MLVTGTRKRPLGRTIVQVAIVLALAFGVLAGAGGYWAVVRSSELSNSPYDPAVIAASRSKCDRVIMLVLHSDVRESQAEGRPKR